MPLTSCSPVSRAPPVVYEARATARSMRFCPDRSGTPATLRPYTGQYRATQGLYVETRVASSPRGLLPHHRRPLPQSRHAVPPEFEDEMQTAADDVGVRV